MLFAQAPQGSALRAALGDDRIVEEASLQRRGEHLFERAAQIGALAWGSQLDQHIMSNGLRQRPHRPGDLFQHQFQPRP